MSMIRMNDPVSDTRTGDRIERLGRSRIQHGKANDRIYLMKLDGSDVPDIVGQLLTLAEKQRYTKIFAKVPRQYAAAFIDAGFTDEACVPRFFNGREDALFLAKFFDAKRAAPSDETLLQAVLDKAQQTTAQAPANLPDGLTSRILTPSDTDKLAALYDTVFDSYPFPIDDPAFLKDAMADETVYFGVFDNGRLVAASSSEMDMSAQNAEMTDFATHPDYRSRGFAAHLLQAMEQDMKTRGIETVYTIARSVSYGMNITFAKLDYQFAGTLVNNTDIGGSLESMNVWYKPLR